MLLQTYIASVSAQHAEASLVVPDFDLEAFTAAVSSRVVLIALGVVLLLILISMLIQRPSELVKRILFWGITIVVASATLTVGYYTVNLNTSSWSGGPVHWHADFELWACGSEINLKDPKGLSNKIGSPSRHEHNDNRLHYEGVVVKPEDAELGPFFKVMGGELTEHNFIVPTNTGFAAYEDGFRCDDGQAGVVNAFVYSVNDDNTTFTQRRLEKPQELMMKPVSAVPPGDCIIIEFGPYAERTSKLCRSYETAVTTGKLTGETR